MAFQSVLVVEDDDRIQAEVVKVLSDNGFAVSAVADGAEGLGKALSGEFALVILDIRLPTMDGLEVCRQLKSQLPRCPVIILSSLGDEVDRVVGLEIGADDYVVKPFAPRELVARVRARLRAAVAPSPSEVKSIEVGELHIDPLRRTISVQGAPIELTAKEFDVVYLLATNPGRPFTKEELLREVWGHSGEALSLYDDSVTSLISRLRRKLEKNPAEPVYLLTARGVGYRFVESHELR